MISYERNLLQRYSTSGVLLDTNVLLLYVIGVCALERVESFKRTADRGYTQEDFRLLDAILARVQKVVTTPHVLTEVSNLAGQLGDPLKTKCFSLFAELIGRMDEQSYPGHVIVQMEVFPRFGLTDSAILALSPGNYLVITDDFQLAGYLTKQGVDVLNFNHLRSFD